ncbi:uncharacterized protein LOC118192737 isoform X2 [Stegodyphus dumicola]|uniref:uncharacterized protein LOC118192737 isoform X2 n=1 Tax=Stegodyphus dumicola TaxID=202533 RepID=UPI0015B0F94A|nr:uncharacterized protein LOC118192737 isoform X2 [Stegodyphus dumicola]
MELESDSSAEIPLLNGINEILKSASSENLENDKTEIACLQNFTSDDANDTYMQSEISALVEIFRNVTQQRILDVENSKLDLSKKNEEKLKILETYLDQLHEQNEILVSTMVELEKEAEQRVRQMEKRLKSSAKSTMEAVINVHECEKEMRRLVEERLYIESLFNNMQHEFSSIKEENSILRDQNCNLNHDVQALLHVIHHARSTGHWEMNCVTFCEVTPEQVFGPVQSISHVNSSHSPQSDTHLAEKEKKTANSAVSSQEILNSSTSTPSSSQSKPLVINLLLEKDKKIALLESHVSELQHRLTSKDAECETHLWKLGILMQQNQNRTDVFHSGASPCDLPIPKCVSFPDIGNIYSYDNVIQKSHSCRAISNIVNPCLAISPKHNVANTSPCYKKNDDRSESQFCRTTNKKTEHPFAVHRAQSEPYLFMFGDSIYVYRPCEPIKKASNVPLHDDYQLSLPPCQSIDLKFPTDDSNLEDWDLMCKNGCIPFPDNSFCEVADSCSSCTSSDSEVMNNSKEMLFSNIQSRDKSKCPSSVLLGHRNFCHEHNFSVSLSNEKSTSKSEKHAELVSSFAQTEGYKVTAKSVCLQTDISESRIEDIQSHLQGMDLSPLKRMMQALKDSVIKAEDKAQAKAILIEQLQGHLTSTIKEVELKDKTLSNVEKKLDLSRNECASLKEQLSVVNVELQRVLKDLEDVHMLNDNLRLKCDAKEEKIEEIYGEQKLLQDQKRALMIQLDAQDDELENTKTELAMSKLKIESSALQLKEKKFSQ